MLEHMIPMDGGLKRVLVMAGAFAVPEGSKLCPTDRYVPPPVMLAPDWDWPYGRECFVNVEEKK
jgi:hypothetical protein